MTPSFCRQGQKRPDEAERVLDGKYSEVGRGRQEAWRKSRKEMDGWMW